jgi:hypothetical protein
MFKWRWQTPSRDGNFHDAPLSDEDMALIRERNPRPLGRLCRRGHRVSGANAYTRTNGRTECKACRALASKRYRARH